MAGRRARGARRHRREHAQHFLRSSRLAADIIRCLDVRPDELVVELGAGSGRLTAQLARVARRVVAIELDSAWADALRDRFENVAVVEGDALRVPLPTEPFRVVGNIPFNRTSAILRRLLGDLDVPLKRADVIVQWEVAWKRASVVPSTLLGLEWGPWYELAVVRRLDASAFEPRPDVDAGLLRIVRREPPLVPVAEAQAYRRLVRQAFDRGPRAVVAPLLFKRAATEFGFARGAAARELDVHQWAGLYAVVRASRYSSRRT